MCVDRLSTDTSRDDDQYQSPAKRRRLPLPEVDFPQPVRSLFSGPTLGSQSPVKENTATEEACEDGDGTITLAASSKQAGQTVAPFLAKHIPSQYAPMGGPHASGKAPRNDPNTKYCYRHRPDLKCRRQVNEPSMDQLQHELEDLSQADQQAIAHVWSVFSASPAKQRNLILQGILSQCCFPQLSYLSTNVRELIRIDFLTALPTELAFKVLCYLDTASLCKAAQVSQRWRLLADDDVVWHRMCEQHIDRKCIKCGWGLPLLERKMLRASKRQIQLRATGRGLNEWSPNITPYPETAPGNSPHDPAKDAHNSAASDSHDENHRARKSARLEVENSYFQLRPHTRPWKDVYKDRFMVGTNWKYGRCNIKVFKGHSNGVTCLQFDDQILATGSYDTTIKIWDIESGKELRTLRGHTSGIRCLQFDATKLISGSLDHTMKIWNWRTGECLSTFSGHSEGIIGLHFDGPTLLATGSIDRTIKIWNFETRSAYVLRGHGDWVNAVRVDAASRTVFSASDDCKIKLWDLDSKSCVKTFEGHVGQVQQVVILPQDFEFEDSEVDDHDGASSTASTQSLAPIPSSTDQPFTEPYGPGFTNGDRPLPPRYILTGALDSTIRLWDTASGKCLRTYFGHVEGIWALAADTLRVVSGAQDRMVKVWDTRGKCERTFTGHAGPVTCIGLSDSRMCSAGEDSEVRMYSF